MAKRMFDLIFSVLGLLFLWPILILTSLAVKLDSKGTVFYRGLRVGLNGKPFRIFKLRSMVIDAETTGVASTSGSDLRVTRVGRFIRKYKT